jgi:hypothetical protein
MRTERPAARCDGWPQVPLQVMQARCSLQPLGHCDPAGGSQLCLTVGGRNPTSPHAAVMSAALRDRRLQRGYTLSPCALRQGSISPSKPTAGSWLRKICTSVAVDAPVYLLRLWAVCVECVGETGRDGSGHSSTRRLVFAPIISARPEADVVALQRPSHGLCGWDPHGATLTLSW